MEEDATKTVIKELRAYLHEEIPPDTGFFHELNSRGFLASANARELAQLADQGKQDCVWKLVTYMEQFYNENMLLRLCDFLEKYAKPARPKLATIASKIRQEILKHKPKAVSLPVPEDPLHHRSAGAGHHAHAVPGTFVPATFPPGSSSLEPPSPDSPAPTTLSPGTSVPGPTAPGAPMSSPLSYTSGDGTSSADVSQHVYYPVIDDLKISFFTLADNVLSIIDSLSRTNLKAFRTDFLSYYLKPFFSPDTPLPVVPETVEDLKIFLNERWDSLQIALLKAVVEHLESRKIEAATFKASFQLVKANLNAYEVLLKSKLPTFLSKCRNESVSLKPILGHSSVSVKIASNPAEISLARILELQGFFIDKLGLPDTLFTGFSEGCIVFFSIPTECVCSLSSCLLSSNLSLLKEWKVLFFSVKGAFSAVDIKEKRVIDSLDKHSLLLSLAEDKIIIEDLQAKVQQMKKDLYLKEEELRVMEIEVKVKVSRKGKGKAVTTAREFEEKVLFEEKPVVKTEFLPYPDIKTEPSPDVNPEPSSKRFKTGSDYVTYDPPLERKSEEEVFRSDLVRPGEHHSVKMPDLLIPTWNATPVTIGRDVYLAGGVTDDVKTAQLVQVYNLDSGDCRTLPPSLQYWSAAVAIDGALVLIGGGSSSTGKPTNMVSTWMAAEERWTQDLPPMKMKRGRPGVLLLNNHLKLIVFGGLGEDEKTLLDCFEVLDLNTKQWRKGHGGLPRPLFSPQLGVFEKYVMLYDGVTSDVTATRACYKIQFQALVDSVSNPESPPIHWTPVQDASYFRSALLTTSQDAVFIGGHRDGQATRAIHRFSSSGSWEVIGELSQPRSRSTVAAVSDRSFLVLGGFNDSNVELSASSLKSVDLIPY